MPRVTPGSRRQRRWHPSCSFLGTRARPHADTHQRREDRPQHLRADAGPTRVAIAVGRIEGRQVTLTPEEIQARVKRLFVDEGATVKEGQVLAELESNQLDARSAALHANLANIDAQIRQASIDVSHTATSTSAAVTAAQAAVSGAKVIVAKARAVRSACSRRCATSSISVTV
jgi:multidrug efflux pump subunit AcrA (membrane-fusion protein)